MAENSEWFKFHHVRFTGGTKFFTEAQKGAFLMLLIHQFTEGSIPSERKKIEKIVAIRGEKLEEVLEKFKLMDGGVLENSLMSETRKEYVDKSVKRSLSGKLGNEKRWQTNRNLIANATDVQSDSDSKNIADKSRVEEIRIDNTKKGFVSEFPFELFWDLYDKKKGSEKAKEKWERIKEVDRKLIFEHIPKYKREQPDPQYRQNPTTYLNAKTWKDEIIIADKNKPTSPIEPTISHPSRVIRNNHSYDN